MGDIYYRKIPLVAMYSNPAAIYHVDRKLHNTPNFVTSTKRIWILVCNYLKVPDILKLGLLS
jgi:hypothetical protein